MSIWDGKTLEIDAVDVAQREWAGRVDSLLTTGCDGKSYVL